MGPKLFISLGQYSLSREVEVRVICHSKPSVPLRSRVLQVENQTPGTEMMTVCCVTVLNLLHFILNSLSTVAMIVKD